MTDRLTEPDPLSGREYCPRCSSGPRQPNDIDECPDCGHKWEGPPLISFLRGSSESPAPASAPSSADLPIGTEIWGVLDELGMELSSAEVADLTHWLELRDAAKDEQIAALQRNLEAADSRFKQEHESRKGAQELVAALQAKLTALEQPSSPSALVQEIEAAFADEGYGPSQGEVESLLTRCATALAAAESRQRELERELAHWKDCHGVTADRLVEAEALNAQQAEQIKQLDEALVELEKAGWPCRLVELPALFRKTEAVSVEQAERIKELQHLVDAMRQDSELCDQVQDSGHTTRDVLRAGLQALTRKNSEKL